jgi:hypothetical protein
MEVVTSPLGTIPDTARDDDARTSNAAAEQANAHIPLQSCPFHMQPERSRRTAGRTGGREG